MPKIKCASSECKWNNDNNMCSFKGTILMNDHSVMTMHDGRKHFHYCKMYEKSAETLELERKFKEYLRG